MRAILKLTHAVIAEKSEIEGVPNKHCVVRLDVEEIKAYCYSPENKFTTVFLKDSITFPVIETPDEIDKLLGLMTPEEIKQSQPNQGEKSE